MRVATMIRRGVMGSAAILALASLSAAQAPDDESNRVPKSRSLFEKLMAEKKPSAPAPKRDLNGAWAGPVDSLGQNFPPFTPLGDQRYKENKPEPIYLLAKTNDPLTTCDPLGFPRNVLN